MPSITIKVKIALVLLFNSLEASPNNITTIINDMSNSIDEIKNKYFLIRYDIFSPKNSNSTNYITYADSLIAISRKLRISRNEIFEKILDQDIEKIYLDKISKIKLKSESLNNSISVLYNINKYYSNSYKRQLSSFADYRSQIKRLVTFEKLLYDVE